MKFHVIIHAVPPDNRYATKSTWVSDLEVRALELEPSTGTAPFHRSFEDVVERLNELPRMFIEPDGSFVWVAETDVERFQLDGVITDDGSRVLNVELKGRGTESMVDQLLRSLDWPAVPLIFQLVHSGLYLDEREFRRLVFASTNRR